MAFTIRRARADETERLREITIEAFDGVSIDQNIERRFGLLADTTWQERKGGEVVEECESGALDVFVAELNGTVTAYVTTRLDPRTLTGHISHLAADPRHQGGGQGRALMEHALEHLRESGMRHARIETIEQNAVCCAFYPRMGFQEVARKIYYAREL